MAEQLGLLCPWPRQAVATAVTVALVLAAAALVAAPTPAAILSVVLISGSLHPCYTAAFISVIQLSPPTSLPPPSTELCSADLSVCACRGWGWGCAGPVGEGWGL